MNGFLSWVPFQPAPSPKLVGGRQENTIRTSTRLIYHHHLHLRYHPIHHRYPQIILFRMREDLYFNQTIFVRRPLHTNLVLHPLPLLSIRHQSALLHSPALPRSRHLVQIQHALLTLLLFTFQKLVDGLCIQT